MYDIMLMNLGIKLRPTLPYEPEVTEHTKVCVQCGEDKMLREFYFRRYRKTDGVATYSTRCKPCLLIYERELRDSKAAASN